jgi:hypothetical protein
LGRKAWEVEGAWEGRLGRDGLEGGIGRDMEGSGGGLKSGRKLRVNLVQTALGAYTVTQVSAEESWDAQSLGFSMTAAWISMVKNFPFHEMKYILNFPLFEEIRGI